MQRVHSTGGGRRTRHRVVDGPVRSQGWSEEPEYGHGEQSHRRGIRGLEHTDGV